MIQNCISFIYFDKYSLVLIILKISLWHTNKFTWAHLLKSDEAFANRDERLQCGVSPGSTLTRSGSFILDGTNPPSLMVTL